MPVLSRYDAGANELKPRGGTVWRYDETSEESYESDSSSNLDSKNA